MRAGYRESLRDALPLLAAVTLLMAGNGLTSTLLGIRSALEGFSEAVTGIILAGYYLGFLLGSLWAPPTIRRVGHIRVFAGLASLASCAVILHIVQAAPLTWFLLRALSGLCSSGLYVATETWLNGAATNATRGTLLGSYMVVVTGGSAVGQLLFAFTDPTEASAFVLATVLVSLAVVPVSLATVFAPDIPDPQPLSLRELVRVAPLGPASGAVSGFTGAAMLGGGAIYAASAGFTQAGTAGLIAAALLGGLAMQIPLGRWSDRTDRRRVLLLASAAGSVAAVLATLVGPGNPLAVIALTLVAGGIAYPLYSIANAHVNDYMDRGKVVAAGARMILVNGAGAIAGPVLGALVIQLFGPSALFVVLAGNYAVIALYAAYRMRLRDAVSEYERSSYVPMPVGSAPTAAVLGEQLASELYPVIDGEIEGAAESVEFREQGNGTPVVLIGDQEQGVEVWDWVLPALASDGFRAIALRSRQSYQSPYDFDQNLLALLRVLDLGSVGLAGSRWGATAAARFAVEYRDRVDALILARPTEDVEYTAAVCPTLVVTDAPLPEDDPEGFADAVAGFLRHGVHPWQSFDDLDT